MAHWRSRQGRSTLGRRRPKAPPEPASVAHAAVPAMRAAEKPPVLLSPLSPLLPPTGCLRGTDEWMVMARCSARSSLDEHGRAHRIHMGSFAVDQPSGWLTTDDSVSTNSVSSAHSRVWPLRESNGYHRADAMAALSSQSAPLPTVRDVWSRLCYNAARMVVMVHSDHGISQQRRAFRR